MIPFIDLSKQYDAIQPEVEDAVIRVLRSGQYILGPEVDALEERLASYVGVPHCVSCASGTDALVIAFMAKGVGPGDAIFTTPFTFMASAEAIALVGATPVFVDIDSSTFNMDPQALRRAIAALANGGEGYPVPRAAEGAGGGLTPRGILPVDLFGVPADYGVIGGLAQAHDLFVIEDAAQSFGASLGNRRAGALAEIGCTSFFPAKPLGCYGDGGALFTSDEGLDALFRSIRVHGQGSDRYEHVRLGITGRLDAVQAAILLVKLGIFDAELAERQRVADTYSRLIADSGIALVPPLVPEGSTSAWAQYSVLAASGEARRLFRGKLAEAKIPTAVYYEKPLHLQRAFEWLGYRRGDFPVAEDVSDRIFSLPMHPYLSSETAEAIIDAMRAG